MIKFLDLEKQYKGIKEEIDQAIFSTIESTAFIGGDRVSTFESDFGAFQNADYCVGVGNGTDALEIAIEALDLPSGSEIIVPANSFISSSEAVTRSGYKVVFCDCDARNYTIDIESVRGKVSSKTAAIIAVHLYGHPCDMDALSEVAEEFDLKIIEDCAQAHGSEYKGKRVGAIGDVGTFSFYPGKNLGAYGDGGAIVTNNSLLATRCKMIANHGRISKYDHEFEGRNSRLDGLQAAILSVKLKYLEAWTEHRIRVADTYLTGLAENEDLVLPRRENWARQVYHLFVVRTTKQHSLLEHLRKKDIQCGIHYPISLPKLEAYRYLGQQNDSFKANDFDSTLISLPIGEHLTDSEVQEVIAAVNQFF